MIFDFRKSDDFWFLKIRWFWFSKIRWFLKIRWFVIFENPMIFDFWKSDYLWFLKMRQFFIFQNQTICDSWKRDNFFLRVRNSRARVATCWRSSRGQVIRWESLLTEGFHRTFPSTPHRPGDAIAGMCSVRAFVRVATFGAGSLLRHEQPTTRLALFLGNRSATNIAIREHTLCTPWNQNLLRDLIIIIVIIFQLFASVR